MPRTSTKSNSSSTGRAKPMIAKAGFTKHRSRYSNGGSTKKSI